MATEGIAYTSDAICRGPLREKIWPERDADERIEALRTEVVGLVQTVRQLRADMEAMLHHQHTISGEPCVKLATVEHPRGAWPHVPVALRLKE